MLEWKEYCQGWDREYGALYLVYAPGYPLAVCKWETGHAFVDIATQRSLQSGTVAYIAKINLPDGVKPAPWSR